MVLAKEPDLKTSAFCYFTPEYSQLQQYGPTMVCGKHAVTDVKTSADEIGNRQRASVKLLR